MSKEKNWCVWVRYFGRKYGLEATFYPNGGYTAHFTAKWWIARILESTHWRREDIKLLPEGKTPK